MNFLKKFQQNILLEKAGGNSIVLTKHTVSIIFILLYCYIIYLKIKSQVKI
jgi:hypothetical protein